MMSPSKSQKKSLESSVVLQLVAQCSFWSEAEIWPRIQTKNPTEKHMRNKKISMLGKHLDFQRQSQIINSSLVEDSNVIRYL